MSHHSACSRAGWNVDLANGSCNRGVLVLGQNVASARAPKDLAHPSTTLLDEISPLARLRPQTTPPPTAVDKTADVVELSVSPTSTIRSRVFKISSFEKNKYIADVCNANYATRGVCLTHLDHVYKLHTMICESREMNDIGSCSMAEKKPPSDRLSAPSPAVDGKLDVPLYLVDGVNQRVLNKKIIDSGSNCASFFKGSRVQLWFKKNGTTVTSKDMISIPQVLNETSSAGNPSLSLSA